ncbi:hypothetical protein HNP49_003259 [Pseudomonas fluvialis]|uniref:Uncharacterized protein n=1 Tax=Pseudomonas fluvialis TaxID=1793966 RepID=A0A7X0EVY7_9PSED|nr:hypothetical protein [Pseudomonas fluvialis]
MPLLSIWLAKVCRHWFGPRGRTPAFFKCDFHQPLRSVSEVEYASPHNVSHRSGAHCDH